MEQDLRGKMVRWARVANDLIGNEERDDAYVGQVGIASSIYADGRPSHDEGCIVTFPDGNAQNLVAEELDLA